MKYDERNGYIEDDKGSLIAFVERAAHEADPTLGHTMAASKRMLAALEELIAEWGEDNDPFWDEARAEIRMAKGGA